tara:strand:+ start:539 stop:898 length:360 start_codon:yes stop_codon:yes gene_type:complete
MPDAYITLTQRMLSKSEINANKTVQQFLLEDFGMEYTDKFFENRNKLTVIGEYIDGEEVNVNFFRRSGRGDKMISIQKLGQYADAGDKVRLLSDSESDGDGTRIYIQVHRQIEAEADAA